MTFDSYKFTGMYWLGKKESAGYNWLKVYEQLIMSPIRVINKFINILWRVTLVTRPMISGFWILCSIYWLYTRRNLQSIITVAVSL
jgi:hypothetical protein